MVYIKKQETEEEKRLAQSLKMYLFYCWIWRCGLFVALEWQLSMLNIKILKMPSGYATY